MCAAHSSLDDYVIPAHLHPASASEPASFLVTSAATKPGGVDGDGLSRHPAAGASRELAHPTYRRDIDGLRALAVLSVLGYYAFPTLVRGGYIGVDVFFVISGYLICGIVFAGTAAGKFSFIEFYGRRVNRIFPALALVLVSCLLVGCVYLLPDEYGQLRRHVNSGALFVANYTLNHEAGYWDTASESETALASLEFGR